MKQIILVLVSAFLGTFSFSQTVTVFNTPGATTYTVPAGCHGKVTVEVYGAGGGGGGSNVNNTGGGGGGAGGYARTIVWCSPGDVFSIEIGAGGAGGGPAGNGGPGARSRWNGVLTGLGGVGGLNESLGATGGAGGTGSAWAENITGTTGGNGIDPTGGNGGDNGGLNGGTGGAGGAATIDGSNGNSYGGGGGGGGKRVGAGNTSGGNGSNGAIIVTVGGVYRTAAPGNWNVAGSWDAMGPAPLNIPCGDWVYVDHAINLTGNSDVLGTLTVNSTGSITGPTRNIKVGKGGVNMGALENYGTVTVKDLKSEPDGCLVPVDPLPVINNYSGGVLNASKIDIGKGCGSGSLYNKVGGTINVSGEFHIDAYVCNEDSIYVGTKTKIHGGTVDCCGYIETPWVDFGENTGRPGTAECQDFCTAGGIPPFITIEGTFYNEVTIYGNPEPANASVDDDSTTFCLGILLPVDLAVFEGTNEGDYNYLSWVSVTEVNNDYYTLERSRNGYDWEYVETVDGAGNDIHSNQYELRDNNPYFPVTYYRLSQIDFDGQKTYFDVISVNGKIQETGFVSALFPNPAEDYATFVYNGNNNTDMLTVQFLNELGQVVLQFEQNVQNGVPASIRTDELKSGLYHVVFIQGNERNIQKLSIIK